MIEQIREYLKEWQFSVGGSYIWTTDIFFSPDWLQGYHGRGIRIFVHPVSHWAKIEIKMMGESEYEKFYEGSCNSFDDFKTILRLLNIDPCSGT